MCLLDVQQTRLCLVPIIEMSTKTNSCMFIFSSSSFSFALRCPRSSAAAADIAVEAMSVDNQTLSPQTEAEMNEQVAGSEGTAAAVPDAAAPAGSSSETKSPEGAAAPAEPMTSLCAKCRVQAKTAEMIGREGYRVELKYVCKPCHATQTQLARKGLQLHKLLGQTHLVEFFSEAALERKNTEDGRLAYGQTRAMLKRHMVQEIIHMTKDTQEAEWQPLSYYELKGYNTAAIEAMCPMERHPVLGPTFKLAIHTESHGTITKDVEKRITEMENDAMQRQNSVAAGVPQMDLEVSVERAVKRKGPLSEEEKEVKKQLRVAQKAAEADRKSATAAAAKHVAGLKAVLVKLEEKKNALGEAFDALPSAAVDEVNSNINDLQEVVSEATKLLDAAAKGKSLNDAVSFKKDKDLGSKIKSGNAALKILNEILRAEKVTVKGQGRGRAGKKN